MKCLNQSQHTCVIKIQIGWVISCESTVFVYTAIQFITTCRFRFSTTNSKPNHKNNNAKHAFSSHVFKPVHIFIQAIHKSSLFFRIIYKIISKWILFCCILLETI